MEQNKLIPFRNAIGDLIVERFDGEDKLDMINEVGSVLVCLCLVADVPQAAAISFIEEAYERAAKTKLVSDLLFGSLEGVPEG